MHRPDHLASLEPYSSSGFHLTAGCLSAAFDAEMQARQAAAVRAMVKQAWGYLCGGRLEEAERLYSCVLEVGPDAEALHCFGLLAYEQRRYALAVTRIREAIALDRGVSAYHCDLGAALQGLGLLKDASSAYQQALELRPGCPIAHVNLGLVYKCEGRLQTALMHCRLAAKFKPGSAEIHMNLGSVLDDMERFEEALLCYERALTLRPMLAEAHYNKGNALCALGRLAEAEACYREAIGIRPGYAKAHSNLGHVLRGQGRLREALLSYGEAVALSPLEPEIRFGQATAQLLSGDFEHGWVGHESRWEIPARPKAKPAFTRPEWDGSRIDGGRVLIWAEQGIGDEVMFAGLIPDVAATGNQCVLECDPRLVPLFARSFPAVEVIAAERKPRDLDGMNVNSQLAIGSLPRLFRASSKAFRGTASPYLVADRDQRDQLRESYGDGRRLVGLAWNTRNRTTGPRRSVGLRSLAPLLAHDEARWVSLQYGGAARLEQEIEEAGVPLHLDRSVDQLVDVDRFAAQVAAMHLVITIDSSVAHLAGALGVPTWVLLPFAPDCRWQVGRMDSPWYPTMRLFRQPRPGDWASVIEEVRGALSLEADLARAGSL